MRKKIVHLLAALLTLDLATIGVTCSVYANYNNNIKSEITIVKMEKWGMTIESNANQLESEDDDTLKFESESGIGLMAPGGGGDLNFTLRNVPKEGIIVTCKNEITISNVDEWKIDKGNGIKELYFPIIFKVGDTDYTSDDMVATEEEGTYKIYPQLNTDSFVRGEDYIQYTGISWRWDFENDEDVALYDKYDTALGNFGLTYDAEGNIISPEVSAPGISAPTISAPVFEVEVEIRVESDVPLDETAPTNPNHASTDSKTEGDTSSNTTIAGTIASNGVVVNGNNATISGTVNDSDSDGQQNDEKQTISGAVTGDSFNIVLWLSLMIISALVILAVIIVLCKRNKGETDETKVKE